MDTSMRDRKRYIRAYYPQFCRFGGTYKGDPAKLLEFGKALESVKEYAFIRHPLNTLEYVGLSILLQDKRNFAKHHKVISVHQIMDVSFHRPIEEFGIEPDSSIFDLLDEELFIYVPANLSDNKIIDNLMAEFCQSQYQHNGRCYFMIEGTELKFPLVQKFFSDYNLPVIDLCSGKVLSTTNNSVNKTIPVKNGYINIDV